jgi:hypothetical protein
MLRIRMNLRKTIQVIAAWEAAEKSETAVILLSH